MYTYIYIYIHKIYTSNLRKRNLRCATKQAALSLLLPSHAFKASGLSALRIMGVPSCGSPTVPKKQPAEWSPGRLVRENHN